MNTWTMDSEETRRVIPSISSAEYVDGYRVQLSFTDGRHGIVDLHDLLWGEVFEPLTNLDNFRQFTVDSELGTIVWPNGADMAPDTLYKMV